MFSKTSKAILGAACVVAMSCGTPAATQGPPQTYTFVLNELGLPVPMNGVAPGFDLDGMGGGAATGTCQQMKPDFTNSSGAQIDNGFSAFYGSMAALIDGLAAPNLSAFVTSKIAAGDFAILVRLTDVNSVTSDDSVGVEVFVKANVCATPGCLTTNMRAGRLDPGQSFTLVASDRVSMVTGRIVAGRLQADINNLTIPVNTGTVSLPLALTGAKLSAAVTSTTLSNVSIGGWLNIDALASNPMVAGTQAAAIVPLLRAQADGMPCAAGVCTTAGATETTCRDISLGATASGVTALITGI